MKKKIYYIFYFALTNFLFAQESIYVEYDPSTIAFGNSSVANIYSQMPAESNPALLTEKKGVSIFYTKRNMDLWTLIENMYYSGFGLSLESSIGNFGVTYKKLGTGEFNFTSENDPTVIGKDELYNYSVILSYAAKFFNEMLSIGGSVKTFGYDYRNIEGESRDINDNFPVAFDFGLLFSTPLFDELENTLFIGTSIHNVGTDYTMKGESEIYSISEPTETVVRYPVIYKIGFSYLIKPFQYETISPLSMFFINNFTTQINDIAYSEDKCISLGFDLTLFELASFRIGSVIYDRSTGVYGKGDVLNWRYGFGINFNPEKFGMNIPISLSFDYSWVPLDLDNVDYYFYNMIHRENLDAFNITLSYNNSIF